jgi:hypothetical protein
MDFLRLDLTSLCSVQRKTPKKMILNAYRTFAQHGSLITKEKRMFFILFSFSFFSNTVSLFKDKPIFELKNTFSWFRCYNCGTQFTVMRRRHHCRNCGQIFCWKVSLYILNSQVCGCLFFKLLPLKFLTRFSLFLACSVARQNYPCLIFITKNLNFVVLVVSLISLSLQPISDGIVILLVCCHKDQASLSQACVILENVIVLIMTLSIFVVFCSRHKLNPLFTIPFLCEDCEVFLFDH